MRPPSPLAIALLLLPVLGACAGGEPPAAPAPEAASGSADVTLTEETNELYEGFIDCPELPEDAVDEPPEGMVVPDGMVITEVGQVGPLLSANGFIDQTPIDLRDHYVAQEQAGLVYLEDEGFEAEILVDRGDFRTYIKASVRCRTGSSVLLLTSPTGAAGGLPVPGQQAGTAPQPPSES